MKLLHFKKKSNIQFSKNLVFQNSFIHLNLFKMVKLQLPQHLENATVSYI